MEALERPSWNPARQCTATNREGERCRRQPIPGGSVCVMHGGSIPAVQESAKRRLIAMVEPIMATFESIVETWDSTRCDKCGKPTGDPMPVIRVGQLVLDRAGFHPTLTVEQAAPPNPFASLDEDAVIEKLQELLAAAIARRDVHRAHALPEAVDVQREDALDAFIVEEEPPIQDPAVPFPLENETPDAGKDANALQEQDLAQHDGSQAEGSHDD
jgi:hypothetical protein